MTDTEIVDMVQERLRAMQFNATNVDAPSTDTAQALLLDIEIARQRQSDTVLDLDRMPRNYTGISG